MWRRESFDKDENIKATLYKQQHAGVSLRTKRQRYTVRYSSVQRVSLQMRREKLVDTKGVCLVISLRGANKNRNEKKSRYMYVFVSSVEYGRYAREGRGGSSVEPSFSLCKYSIQ